MKALLINICATLASDDHPRHHVGPVSLAIAAAVLESRGWTVEFIDEALLQTADENHLRDVFAARAPDLLLIHTNLAGVKATARLLATPVPSFAIRLAMGNAVAHASGHLLAETVDDPRAPVALLLGEGEAVLMDIVDDLGQGRIPDHPALLRKGGSAIPHVHTIDDPDRLPMPAQHFMVGRPYRFMYPIDARGRLRMAYMLTSRGCPHGCIFCSEVERVSVGRHMRYHSVERVISEIRQVRDLGANGLYFSDDNFGEKPDRVEQICRRMIDEDLTIPWVAQVRAGGFSPDLLALMRKSGCSSLCLGVESGNDNLLDRISKGIDVSQIREQFGLIHEAGIGTVAYIIIGLPDETDDERRQSFELLKELRPDIVQVHIYNVAPGSKVWQQNEYAAGTIPSSKYVGSGMDPDRLRMLDDERRRFYVRYYTNPRYIAGMLVRRWRYLLSNWPWFATYSLAALRFFVGRAR